MILYIYINLYLLQGYYNNFGVHSFPKFVRSQIRAKLTKLNQNLWESQTFFIGDFSESRGSAKDPKEGPLVN